MRTCVGQARRTLLAGRSPQSDLLRGRPLLAKAVGQQGRGFWILLVVGASACDWEARMRAWTNCEDAPPDCGIGAIFLNRRRHGCRRSCNHARIVVGLRPNVRSRNRLGTQIDLRLQGFASPPRGLRILWMGQAEAMGKLIRRSTILTAALAPIAALSLVTPAAGSAQPLDCQNGEWWDPVANVCQPPAAPVPLGCQNGDWWDPVGNVCKPPLVPFPPNCGGGQYWNPVSNACRPLGQV